MTYVLIGCGNLGEIILNGLYLKKKKISVVEKNDKINSKISSKYKRIKTFNNFKEINWPEIRYIMICVKPKDCKKILNEIKEFQLDKHIVVSFVAGLSTSGIKKCLGSKSKIVRIMPNIFISSNNSATAVYMMGFEKKLKTKILKDFDHFGILVEVNQEKKIDFFTAMFGGGPAYIFFILEIFNEIIKNNGFSEKESLLLLTTLVEGVEKRIKENNFNFKLSINQVASKGGTTEEALKFFLKKNSLSSIINKAIKAAKLKSVKISKDLDKLF